MKQAKDREPARDREREREKERRGGGRGGREEGEQSRTCRELATLSTGFDLDKSAVKWPRQRQSIRNL